MPERPTKVRIKASFVHLLGSTPYSKITMTMLARELGMSRQNLYKYFSSKEEILAELATDLSDSVLEQTLMLMDGGNFRSGTSAWTEILSQGLDILLEHRDLISSMSRSGAEEVTFRLLKNMTTRILGHLARVNGITIRDHEYFELITLNAATSAHQVLANWAASGMVVSTEKVKLLLLDSANASVIEKLKLCEHTD